MKRRVEIKIFEVDKFTKENGKTLSREAFSKLRSRWPECFAPHRATFLLEADEDDPVVEEVIEFLRQHSREPYRKQNPCLSSLETGHDVFYQVKCIRVFELEDYRRAEFFQLSAPLWISQDYTITDGGYYRLPQKSITKVKIGSVFCWQLPVCRDSLKRQMEAEGFAGLQFQHVEIADCRKPMEPLWKLESDRRMPPVLNRLCNHMGVTFDPAAHYGCWPDDDYWPSLLRYSRAAVEALGEFDAALTAERYGVPLDPILIVSRRFRDWCQRQKLKLDWYPVALE